MINFKALKKPFIIAEIGINHEGNFNIAKKLIFEAKKAGADGVKFQIFKPFTLANKMSKKSNLQKKSSGKKENLYKIWKKMELNYIQIKKLRSFAKKINIYFICSVFDVESLEKVRNLNIDAYKIASSDITDSYLQKYISKEKKPIILSTGMSDKKDIKNCIKNFKTRNLVILHCVSLYPCEKKQANLNRIISLKENFNYAIGYSDHCTGINAAITSIFLGAKVVEKHFTFNKKKIGLDHKLSADYNDLKAICDFAKDYQYLFGKKKINPSPYEKSFRKLFRKGIYFRKNVKKGKKILEKDIIIRRPMNITHPKEYEQIINKIAKKNFSEGETVNKKYIN